MAERMSGEPCATPSLLDLIGETPLIELTHFDRGPCRLFLKLESANPSGSIKDRPARGMIERAEADGTLKAGGTIVEATAGNTGLGLALVGARKGYRIVLVVPDKMAREKILHCRAMGAEVMLTRSDVGRGHPDYYQDLAEAIAARTPGAVFINQFANPANPFAHQSTTGPEILRQMQGRVDAVVVGVGSGGTLTGVGRYMAKASPGTRMILADPAGSVLAPFVESGRIPEKPGSWAVEGIGEDFLPANADLSLVQKAYSISDPESFAAARDLLRHEGVLAGSSTGTLLAAALRYCREQNEPRRVVTLACDSGAKYLSKVFNPVYAAQEGWDYQRSGKVRDVVFSRFPRGEEIVVAPDDPLRTAFVRMRSADVSQLPVLDGERIVGLIDESDMLAAVLEGSAGAFETPVKEVMVTRLETISADAPIRELVPLFRRDLVAIVMDAGRFLGIATRLDLVNYFRIVPTR
jgi:cystathionine beta-synthase